MRLVLRYVEKTKTGSWQYRRRVPKDIASVIHKREFKGKLGNTNSEALAAYHAFHKRVEREISEARRSLKTGAAELGEMSDLQIYNLAYERVVEMGAFDLDWDARDELVEAIYKKYPREENTGYPINPSKMDEFLISFLGSGRKTKPPKATLSDAQRFYLEERSKTNEQESWERLNQHVDRVVRLVIEAMGKDPVLESITRQEARNVRDYMLQRLKADGKPISPSSVARDVNTLNAVINYAAQELPLPATFRNPFSGLKIQGARGRRDSNEERDPLPDDILQKARERIINHGKAELGLIWRLLEGTGCRLAEITGLSAEDIDVTSQFPNLRVTWHEHRRLKTASSRRLVPLVGDALDAAKQALATTRKGDFVFPSYCRSRGSDAASAALMSHLRTVTSNPKHVVHSLRHNMKDRLRLAEVPATEQNLILGHELNGVGDQVYGGEHAKLRVTTRAMRKAFGLLGSE